MVSNVHIIVTIHGRSSSAEYRCLQQPLVLGAPSISECVEAGQTSVTPVSCHTWLTAAPSRVVTSSAKRTCNQQGRDKEIFNLYGIRKQLSSYGTQEILLTTACCLWQFFYIIWGSIRPPGKVLTARMASSRKEMEITPESIFIYGSTLISTLSSVTATAFKKKFIKSLRSQEEGKFANAHISLLEDSMRKWATFSLISGRQKSSFKGQCLNGVIF